MDQNTDPMSSNSNLCRSGCGFYGSPSTNGLCSKCHKDALKRKQATPGSVSVPVTVAGKEETPSKLPTENAVSNQESIETAVPTVQLVPASSSQSHEANSSISCAEPQATSHPGSASAGMNDTDKESQQQEQKKKNKCNVCRRKLGLTGFQCRCGGSFCSVHRYANEHNCTFDYKSLGAQEIKKNNPVVVAEKIKKI